MRVFLAAAFVLSGFVTPVSASAEEVKLDGTWVITVEDRGRQRDYYLELKQDGAKVGGTFISPRSGSFAIKEGTFQKDALKLVVPRNLGGAERIFEIVAKLGADGVFTGTLTVDGNEGGGVVIKKDNFEPTAVGRWLARAGSKDGGEPLQSIIEITEDKEGKFSGRSLSDSGDFPLNSIKFDGKKLSYTLVLDFGGEKVSFVVEAELKGRFLLSGKWFDKAQPDFGGPWTANRASAGGREARGRRPEGQRPEGRERPEGQRPEGRERSEGRRPEGGGRGEGSRRRPRSTAAAFVGKWYADVEMPGGESQKFVISFGLAENKVTGSVKAPDGSSFKIISGSVEERKITFKINYSLDGVDTEVELEGELEGRGAIKGTWGAEGEEGGWKASRARTL